MMTPGELKRFIRFALDRLRTDNAHHEFEHLCRAIATARISRNIIPATGPVASGGDQGRDAESVPRYDDAADPIRIYGDLGRRTVVLTATLQRERVDRKILTDLETIRLHPELRADVVVAFTEADIPIARRNRLKRTARADHDIELHVIDGTAIAEFLAAHDLNWVAHKYLDLPREAAPTPRADEADARYLAQRLKWADRAAVPTWGDLEQLSTNVRHAYQNGLTADVGLWLKLIEPLSADHTPVDIRRSAIYEIALAFHRGLETLQPCKDHLEWYFETICDVKPSSSLADAQILVFFCFGAAAAGFPGASLDDVNRWYSALVEHLDRQIDDTDNPARLYQLLLVRGSLEQLSGNKPTFADLRHWWDQALEHAHAATMLPIDLAADRLPPLAPLFAHDPDFHDYAARLDDLSAQQGGESVAADQAVNRGIALLNADSLTAALRELHRAKDRLLAAHDTVRLLSVLTVIGDSYRRLRLWWAAKNYFLAAATIAVNSSGRSHRRYVAIGLAEAAGCDYTTGAWRGFIDLAGIATRAHGLLDADPGDVDAHPFLGELATAVGFVTVVAIHHLPADAEDAQALAAAHLPAELLEELRTDPPEWIANTDGYAARLTDSHMRPFDDAGATRTLAWSAHGVEWSLTAGESSSRIPAERLAAAIQVVQAEFASFDYVPLPTVANVRVAIGDNGEVAEIGPGRFVATIPPWPDDSPHEQMEHVLRQTAVAAVALIARISTIPLRELGANVEACMDRNLANKITVFRIYDEILRQWTPANTDRQANDEPPGSAPRPWPSHDELAWPTTPGPGYTTGAVAEALGNRYTNLSEMTAATRQRLAHESGFDSIVAELRRRGWLDWHILGAINQVAATFRARRNLARDSATLQTIGRLPMGPENPADEVPASEFTLDALVLGHESNNIATLLTTWNLELRVESIPTDAVTQLLRVRYGHYSDDIPHENPFAATGELER